MHYAWEKAILHTQRSIGDGGACVCVGGIGHQGGWFFSEGQIFLFCILFIPLDHGNQVCLSAGLKKVCSPYKRTKTQGEETWLTKANAFSQSLPCDLRSSFFRFLPLLSHVSPFSSFLPVLAGILRAGGARPPPLSVKRKAPLCP